MLYEAENESQNLAIWDITRCWYYAEINEPEKVTGWIRSPVQRGFAPISIDRALLVRLRCLIGAGQHAETLALIDQFEALAKNKAAIISLLYVELSRAIIHDQQRDMDSAITAMRSVR